MIVYHLHINSQFFLHQLYTVTSQLIVIGALPSGVPNAKYLTFGTPKTNLHQVFQISKILA